MPRYDYECTACGHTFEADYRISKRDEPTMNPCEKCEKKTIKRGVSNGGPVDPILVNGLKKIPQNFKDKLKAMEKLNPNMKSDWV